MLSTCNFTMDSYLPIIFHLKEIASLYKRTGKFAATLVDCHSTVPVTNIIPRDEEQEKDRRPEPSIPFQPVTCCGYCFRHPSHHLNHLNSIYHSTRLQRTCRVCAKYFKSKKMLALHMRKHDSRPKYRCQVCDCSFITKRLLSEHMQQEHISLFSVKCDECEFKTWKGSYLAKHMIKFHRQAPPSKDSFKPSKDGFKPHTCCGRTFKYPSLLEKHRKHCKPLKSHCKICNEYFGGSEALQEHRTNVHNVLNGKWVCMICSESFSSNGTLTMHLKAVHIKSTVFECAKCSFSTTRKYILSRHFQRSHTGQTRCFKCDTCGRMFRGKDTLAVHIRNVHLSNIPHCNICSRQFKSVEAVEKHKLVHRPCQICGATFRLTKQRERHYQKHLSGKLQNVQGSASEVVELESE